MGVPENCILVIFGASGDLTRRKLVPGLYNLHRRGLLPAGFAVLGTGRTQMSDADFRQRMHGAIDEFVTEPGNRHAEFLDCLHYQPVDTQVQEDFATLAQRLKDLDARHRIGGNYLYYLSTPPSLFEPIAAGLAGQGLNQQSEPATPAGDGVTRWKRLIVEKPYGYDLKSAIVLNDRLHSHFIERQVFRIDHYLGKETVQNMLVFRFANGLYEPLWNRNFIERIEVTAAESIGVEGRGGYYEHSGALRDMFQNHLLQVVGMLAMEPPAIFSPAAVRNETVKVFESLSPFTAETVDRNVVRGQYTSSRIAGADVAGYRQEKGVAANSATETFVAVRFFVNNWRWAGVPFLVRTGKRLPTRVTEAVVHFRHIPHQLFGESSTPYGPNQLIIRVQPDEGIILKFNMKVPGEGFHVRTVDMDFLYSDLIDTYVPEAYERLLLDSILGDATLYARGDAVEQCWRFVDPILQSWKSGPEAKLYGYPAGSWGPRQANLLLGKRQNTWRNPVEALTDSDESNEL